jgi:hypothetical protein
MGAALYGAVKEGFENVNMVAGWEKTKDGIKNMLDPQTANSISKQDPHAEVAQYGTATPSGLAGGVASLFGFGVENGQTTSSLNTYRKPSQPDPAMNFTPTGIA